MIESKTGTILSEIVKAKKAELNRAKESTPLEHLRGQAAYCPPTRPFAAPLRQQGKVALIAEVKKRSPSKGMLCRELDVPATVRAYTRGGASAVSVVVDSNFFGGEPAFVSLARQNTHLPVLYKEFILDPYQLYQARIAGADAVLLIVKILAAGELAGLLALATKLGLETLVETSSAREIQRAREAGAKMIGINNRNLATFQTTLQTTLSLRREITDPGIVLVSESGIRSPGDMQRLLNAGVNAALVGETLMRSPDPEAAVRNLLIKAASGGNEL